MGVHVTFREFPQQKCSTKKKKKKKKKKLSLCEQMRVVSCLARSSARGGRTRETDMMRSKRIAVSCAHSTRIAARRRRSGRFRRCAAAGERGEAAAEPSVAEPGVGDAKPSASSFARSASYGSRRDADPFATDGAGESALRVSVRRRRDTEAGSAGSGADGAGLSREERDLAANVRGLLQRERVRLDRDVKTFQATAYMFIKVSTTDYALLSWTSTSNTS